MSAFLKHHEASVSAAKRAVFWALIGASVVMGGPL
jgi:hypothetical protein